MRVAVVGSCLTKGGGDSCNNRPLFEVACRLIGQTLAKRKDRLIVAHPESQDSAEFYALEGFRRVGKHDWDRIRVAATDHPLKAHIDAVAHCDAVVLIGGANGTMAAGLAALRAGKVIVPVAAFGGATDQFVQMGDLDARIDDELKHLRVGDHDWKWSLTSSLDRILSSFPRVLIIHGRGDSGRELKKRIETESDRTSRLRGIASPMIMSLTGRGAASVPTLFEKTAEAVSAAIVIVTADDLGGVARSDDGRALAAFELRLDRRARENVWVEVGWCWARLGRERVFIWFKDSIGLPSDLQGVASTHSKDLNGAWKSIRDFLIDLRTASKRAS